MIKIINAPGFPRIHYMIAPGLISNVKVAYNKLTAEEIIKTCSKYFEVDPLKKNRTQEFVWCRQFCFLLIKENTSYSFARIGDLFKQDHTTVIYGISKIKDLLATEEKMREHLNRILNLLKK